MKRRDLIRNTAFAVAAASLGGRARGAPGAALKPPARGSIPVAFLVSEGAVVLDFCGPWEVFQDAQVPGRPDEAFSLYTVSESTRPIRASAGLKIVPDYDFATAPAPKVIVIPAQRNHSPAALAWVRSAAKNADLTMSVCTGAFLLAETGLLTGKAATTHHNSFRRFATAFPGVQLRRGARFVDEGNLATAGGLSSGIDLALRVVERYYGRDVARNTAWYMEYQGEGWMNPDSNSAYAAEPVAAPGHALCPVCQMDVDPATAPHATFQGKTYSFCSDADKQAFEASPGKFAGSTAR